GVEAFVDRQSTNRHGSGPGVAAPTCRLPGGGAAGQTGQESDRKGCAKGEKDDLHRPRQLGSPAGPSPPSSSSPPRESWPSRSPASDSSPPSAGTNDRLPTSAPASESCPGEAPWRRDWISAMA